MKKQDTTNQKNEKSNSANNLDIIKTQPPKWSWVFG